MIIFKYPTYEDQIQAISDDMTLNNEGSLMGLAEDDARQYLTVKGSVGMGFMPRGDATPTGVSGWHPTDTTYKAADYWWDIITPWFVASKGVNHTATNTIINVSGISIQIYDNLAQGWRKLPTGDGNPTWCDDKSYANKLNTHLGTSVYREESDGSWSIKFRAEPAAMHGGSSRFVITDAIPDRANIGGVIVRIITKLALDDPDGVDDRHLAEILLCAAADYWPRIDSRLSSPNHFTPMTYIPNVGIGRFGLVGIEPRAHFMATIDPPGTPPSRSEFTLADGVVTMPKATFDSRWPPYIPHAVK